MIKKKTFFLFFLVLVCSLPLILGAVTKTYDASTETISIYENGTNTVNFTLVENTYDCITDCHANITGVSTADVFLFEDVFLYDKNNQVRTIEYFNVTTYDDKGKITSEKVKYKGVFNIYIEGIKKAHETVDWILTVMGLDLSEWALWGNQAYDVFDSSVNYTLWENASTGLASSKYIAETSDYITVYTQGADPTAPGTNYLQTKLLNSSENMNLSMQVKLNCTIGVMNTWGYANSTLYIYGTKINEVICTDTGGAGETNTDTSIYSVVKNDTDSKFYVYNDAVFVSAVTPSDSKVKILVAHESDDSTNLAQAQGFIYYLNYTNSYIVLNSPSDSGTETSNLITFNATALAKEGTTLVNMSLYTNETGTWALRNTTTGLSTRTHTQTWTRTIVNDTLWGVESCDSDGDCGFSVSNYSFIINLPPQITINSPPASVSNTNVTFNFTFSDDLNALQYCSYNVTTSGGGTIVAENSINCSNGVEYQTISAGVSYILNVFANDTYGNTNVTSTEFDVVIGGGGGGGGGGGFVASLLPSEYVAGQFCIPYEEKFAEVRASLEFVTGTWNKIVYIWDSWWDFALCSGSSATIIPL